MAQVKLFGYADKISVKPGEAISIHVNADGTSKAEATLVRLIHGDEHPSGPGFIEEEIASPLNGEWKLRKQYTQVGAFLTVADPDQKLGRDGDFTLCAFICPTLHGDGVRQALIGRWDIYKNEGFALWINQRGFLEFGVGDGKEVDYLQAEAPLVRNMWYFVAASYDRKSGSATLYQEGVATRYNSLLGKVVPYDYRSHVRETFRFQPKNPKDLPFLVAGARDWHAVDHKAAQTRPGAQDAADLERRCLLDPVDGQRDVQLFRLRVGRRRRRLVGR